MDTSTLAIIALLGGFVLLMLVRVPITFALLFSTLLSATIHGTNLSVLVRQMVDGVNNFSLLSIPFFILMGEFMSAGGISEKIVNFANLLVGRFRGGLAYVNVIDSMFFGGISGSAVADVSSLGSIVIPMMEKQGYDREFAVGLTVTTACQAVLIPPSHNMVIYALAAGAGISIGQMFIAGLLPGMLLGASLILLCFFMAEKYRFPQGFKTPREQWGKILIDALLPMLTLVIIMGGTGLGIFTATESSAIACVYTFILAFFIFRTAKFRDIGKMLVNALKTLAIVMALIACAKAFAYMMTALRVPNMVSAMLLSITDNKIVLMLIINALLLVLGCFMDMAPLIMIMTPILFPIVTGTLGMDPIHFGVMLIFNLAMGLCTPPVGSALFVGCAVGKTRIESTSKKMLPMFAVMLVALMIVTFVPAISLWLPSIM